MSEEMKENIKAYYIGSDIDKVLDYIQHKENIIKEVREYIEQCQLGVDSRDRPVMLKFLEEGRNLLEILDKEVN